MTIHSKIIGIPTFKTLPKTDCADVKENIDNWIEREKQYMIDTFLRPDPTGYRGYRFITDEDLTETHNSIQKILGVLVKFTFTRFACRKDHFCPLYFTEWYNRSIVLIELPNGESFNFKSDNNLVVKIREYKKAKK